MVSRSAVVRLRIAVAGCRRKRGALAGERASVPRRAEALGLGAAEDACSARFARTAESNRRIQSTIMLSELV